MKNGSLKSQGALPLLLTVSLLLAATVYIYGLDVYKIKDRRVHDTANILNQGQQDELERMMMDTEQKTSSQIALLTIPSLEGEALEDYSLRVAEQSELGQKGLNNGALILVAVSDRKVRIEVGYGLEPILTDIKSGYIIRKLITPSFKKGDYFSGLRDGLKAVTGIVNKEFDISPEDLEKFRKESKKSSGSHFPFAIFIFIFFVIINSFKRKNQSGGSGIGRGIFMSSGGWSSRSSSGGGWGGFSGGGGSFGGGGSSGSW